MKNKSTGDNNWREEFDLRFTNEHWDKKELIQIRNFIDSLLSSAVKEAFTKGRIQRKKDLKSLEDLYKVAEERKFKGKIKREAYQQGYKEGQQIAEAVINASLSSTREQNKLSNKDTVNSIQAIDQIKVLFKERDKSFASKIEGMYLEHDIDCSFGKGEQTDRCICETYSYNAGLQSVLELLKEEK